MTDSYKNIMYLNTNHSHPEYPDGWRFGELCLHDNGIVFTFRDKKLSPLVIAWKNLQSTYPSIKGHPSALYQSFWWLSVYGSVYTVATAGQAAPNVGSVSIKYKDVALDKIIVNEFLYDRMLRFQLRHWIDEVDSKIWKYKKLDRGLE